MVKDTSLFDVNDVAVHGVAAMCMAKVTAAVTAATTTV
jgi:hypothetical protein